MLFCPIIYLHNLASLHFKRIRHLCEGIVICSCSGLKTEWAPVYAWQAALIFVAARLADSLVEEAALHRRLNDSWNDYKAYMKRVALLPAWRLNSTLLVQSEHRRSADGGSAPQTAYWQQAAAVLSSKV